MLSLNFPGIPHYLFGAGVLQSPFAAVVRTGLFTTKDTKSTNEEITASLRKRMGFAPLYPSYKDA
ncbi:MAG: hypothetical protein C4576_15925 [Desulfobacteraceae bacterium]|nr:MAG: hypothetical protein C4576_15925 [Desulfobacteraceae bacterium]